MMKRRRFDSDDDDDEFIEVSHYAVDLRDQEDLPVEVAPAVSPEEKLITNTKKRLEMIKRARLSLVQPDDRDYSSVLFSVLPSKLLMQSYAATLAYLPSERECDAHLLCQYLPSSKLTDDAGRSNSAPNSLNIQPGVRWDGVIRGRVKVLKT